MLRVLLKFIKPSYALIALISVGAFQGYSWATSTPGWSLFQSVRNANPQAQADEEKSLPSGLVARTIASVHPAQRVVYWLVAYILICFACIPLIRRSLQLESNGVNGMMVAAFCLIGLVMAFVLSAFQFTWGTALSLIGAFLVSGGTIVWLASQLEEMRVRDSMG